MTPVTITTEELQRLCAIESRLVSAWQTADGALEHEWHLLTCEDLRRQMREIEALLGYKPSPRVEDKGVENEQ